MKFLILFLLCACVTQQEVRGQLYLNDGLPKELCDAHPELKEYGVYRVVEDHEEMLPYCSNRIKEFLSADRVYVEEWLRRATRPR